MTGRAAAADDAAFAIIRNYGYVDDLDPYFDRNIEMRQRPACRWERISLFPGQLTVEDAEREGPVCGENRQRV